MDNLGHGRSLAIEQKGRSANKFVGRAGLFLVRIKSSEELLQFVPAVPTLFGGLQTCHAFPAHKGLLVKQNFPATGTPAGEEDRTQCSKDHRLGLLTLDS